MYQDRYEEVRNQLNDFAKHQVKRQMYKSASKVGFNLAKKGAGAAGKLLAKAAKAAVKALIQAIIKAVGLLVAKFGVIAVVVILVILFLVMMFSYEYKGVFRNFSNDESKENIIGYTNTVSGINVPPEFMPFYQKAASYYDVDWWTLAAIHYTETSFSKNVKTSSAGAIGHMQFIPTTWYGNDNTNQDPAIIKRHRGFGVDADGDGKADPYNIQDAILTAANYLSHDNYRTSPIDALSLYGASKKYALKVMATGKALSGQSNELDNNSWWNNFSLVSMSSENEAIQKRYQNLSRDSIKIIDRFEQENNYRTSWGLLAALDTFNQMSNNTDLFLPEKWDSALRPSFTYKKSVKITEQTIKHYKWISKIKGGSYWEEVRTETIKPINEEYLILDQANTFAGIFTHSYKTQITNDERIESDGSVKKIIYTKINKQVPSYTTISPDFSKLVNLMNANNLDGTEFPVLLESADTFESGQIDSEWEDSFWSAAYNQMDQNNIYKGESGSLPGSIGTGLFGDFSFWPLSNANRISSPFGWRIHPVLMQRKYHSGLDLSGPEGSYQIKDKPILAVSQGTVIYSGIKGNYGYVTIIDHGNGVSTLYAHMRDLPLVSLGNKVLAGQVIGYVGTTGRSTGEHLHFEVRINGLPRNPLDWSFGGTRPVNLDAFQN